MKKQLQSFLLFVGLCVFTYLICAFYATSFNLANFPEGLRFFGVAMFIISAIIAGIVNSDTV